MKEYLIISIVVTTVIFLFDRFVGTKVYELRSFWKMQIITALLLTFVDHFSAALPIVIYNSDFILGFRIREIPIENYLFGFAMIHLNIVLYEKYKNFKIVG